MDKEIKEIIDKLEERISLHNIIKEPISDDLDKAIKLSVAYEELLEENQQLKEKINCDLKWALKYDKLYQENQQLKEQLEKERKARKEAIDYINFLVIIDTQLAGGRFKDTIWGKELLDILDIDKGE